MTLDTLFSNTFFQLPMMEGMMYIAVVLLIGAGIVGVWDRMTGSRPSESAESYDFKQAA